MVKYSNARAMRSLIKASLQSIIKSPSSIIFTLAFPLIFILVFGFIGGGGGYSIKVAAAPGSDTTSPLYNMLHHVPVLKWVAADAAPKDSAGAAHMLQEGTIAATIAIQRRAPGTIPEYKIQINSTSSQVDNTQQLKGIAEGIVQLQDPEIQKRKEALASVDVKVTAMREYKRIDFILPGQLSFSLLATGVFGTAFVFFNLRQTLVLKRFFATPVRKGVIVISEGVARMVFQLMGAVIIISIGRLAFGFTLYHGFFTFIEMLVVCAIGLLVFMGFGFIVSSIAKSDSAIPPFSNLITLPQFLLAGTFFSIDNFPKWLQPICNALPLTYLNDALRRIAYDGAGFWDVRADLLLLMAWGIVIYAIAGRTFKWE